MFSWLLWQSYLANGLAALEQLCYLGREQQDLEESLHHIWKEPRCLIGTILCAETIQKGNKIQCFSALISCKREECTISPGLLLMEERNEAGAEMGCAREAVQRHWKVVLWCLGRWLQRICVWDQKPQLAQAEIIPCFCDTTCSTWALLSLRSFWWHYLLTELILRLSLGHHFHLFRSVLNSLWSALHLLHQNMLSCVPSSD